MDLTEQLSHYKNKVLRRNLVIKELKAQIEKMKCCENCSEWHDGDCQSEHTYDCKRWDRKNTEDYWDMK